MSAEYVTRKGRYAAHRAQAWVERKKNVRKNGKTNEEWMQGELILLPSWWDESRSQFPGLEPMRVQRSVHIITHPEGGGITSLHPRPKRGVETNRIGKLVNLIMDGQASPNK